MNHVFICAGCHCLSSYTSCDTGIATMTCSVMCGKHARRNGIIKTLKTIADALGITPAMLLQAVAVRELLPQLAAEIQAGKDPNAVFRRPEIYKAYIARIAAEGHACRTPPFVCKNTVVAYFSMRPRCSHSASRNRTKDLQRVNQ